MNFIKKLKGKDTNAYLVKKLEKNGFQKNGTNHLIYHQRVEHKNIQLNSKGDKMMSLTKEEKKRIQNDCLNIIVEDLRPFSLFETPAFHHYLQTLRDITGYSLPTPCDDTLNSNLSLLNTSIFEKIKNLFQKIEFFSATSDMSTRGTRYFVLTAHYINEDWKLKKILLGAWDGRNIVSSPHIKAKDLSILIKKRLKELDIENKLFVLTTDGEKRERKIGRELGVQTNYCVDHFLDLSCRKGHEEVELLLSRHNKLVTLFSTSDVGREYLKLAQVGQEKRIKVLKTGSDTRVWLGQYNSIQHSLKLKNYTEEALKNWGEKKEKIKNIKLSDGDWKELESFLKVEESIHDAHKQLEGRDYVTSSYAIPLLFGALNQIKGLPEFTKSIEKMKDKIINELSSRLKGVSVSVLTSSFFDSRFKTLDHLSNELKNLVYGIVKQDLQNLSQNSPTINVEETEEEKRIRKLTKKT